MPLMVDLCSGLGGASVAMRERGWRVVTVDIVPALQPTVLADIRHLPLRCRPDLLWASPPCTEFSRSSMPWFQGDQRPTLALVEAVWQAVKELQPRWWILENVRGLRQLIGPARQTFGSVYLWGDFPLVLCNRQYWKQKVSGRSPGRRAEMPYALSLAVAQTIERSLEEDGQEAASR